MISGAGRPMKILVTGASGFIGGFLVPRLSVQHEVVALGRATDELRIGGKVEIVAMDLSRGFDDGLLPGTTDVIIHLAQANVTLPDSANEMFAINTASTQLLLDYARRARVKRFIFGSSGDVYGTRVGFAEESDWTHPEGFYAVTKRASELLLLSYRDYFQPCVLRLFHPFGPGQLNRLMPKLADRIRSGESVRLNRGEGPHFTPLYVADVITAIVRAVDSSFAGVVNLAGDTCASVRELAVAVGGVLGCEPKFEETDLEAGDMMGCNKLMKRTFGEWEMVSLTEGLARTFRYQGGSI